jgi:Cdc6-like AAA superfamily ATPase
MSRTYPQRNPFPYQGTRSIVATDLDSDEASGRWPTLVSGAITRALEFTQAYLRRFSTEQLEIGQPLILCGPHGCGKTHAVFYIMQKVAEAFSISTGFGAEPFQIYVRTEGPDFLMLYREIMKHVSRSLLYDLSQRFLESIIGKQARSDLPNKELACSWIEEIHRNPNAVSKLFQEYVIEEGAVQDRQAKEVAGIAGRNKDFQRALSFLLSESMSETAYRWFLGDNLSLDDVKKLGVSGSITRPEMGKWAIQLLVSLFHRAGQPFILYLDQYERLVLEQFALTDQDKARLSENAGILHSLVETVPRENGMIVLSGREDAWALLPQDVRQRFSANIVSFPILTVEEARDLVRIYLDQANPVDSFKAGPSESSSSDGGSSASASDSDLSPFNLDAIAEIHRFGGGNIRRLLQICSLLFEQAFAKKLPITRNFVVKTLSELNQMQVDGKTVNHEIEFLLRRRSLKFVSDFRFNDAKVDFAVFTPDGILQFLIKITGAVFHDDEVRSALNSVALVNRIRREAAPPPFVLVVVGYVSGEVVNTIESVADEVVVYRPDTFPEEFAQVLDRLTRAAPAKPADLEERKVFERQLAEIKAELEKLASSRDQEARATNARVEELLKQQELTRNPVIHNLPLPPNPLFRDREAELKKLREQLQKRGEVAMTQSVAVHGLGGVGKTQLAIEYAWKHFRDYDAVLWVRADSPDSLDEGLAALAPLLALPEAGEREQIIQIKAVLRWLHGHERWLLIADNADTDAAAIAVRDRLPPNLPGAVLITSRLSRWPVNMSDLRLDFFSSEDASHFLLDRVAKESHDAGDKAAAQLLADELGNLPLALEQAAAFIIELRWSFDQYRRYFGEARLELLNYQVEGGTRYPVSVAKTWSMTLERLSPLARTLLRIAAWLASDEIPRGIFRADHRVFSEALGENVGLSDLAVDKALGELDRLSLIRIRGETVSVHRLLQAVEQDSLSQDERERWLVWAVGF